MHNQQSRKFSTNNTRRRYNWMVVFIATTALIYYVASDNERHTANDAEMFVELTDHHSAQQAGTSVMNESHHANPFMGNATTDEVVYEQRERNAQSSENEFMARARSQSGAISDYSDTGRYAESDAETINAIYGSASNPYRYNNKGEIISEDCPPLYAGGNDYARARLEEMGCLPAQ